MSKTSKLYDQIKGHLDTFEAEHAKNMAGNKAAGSRARKAIGEVKKLVTDYRKASVAGEKFIHNEKPRFVAGFFFGK